MPISPYHGSGQLSESSRMDGGNIPPATLASDQGDINWGSGDTPLVRLN
jgi:hypothetical protein